VSAADRRADQLRRGDGGVVDAEPVTGTACWHQLKHEGSVVGPERGDPDRLAGFQRDEQPYRRGNRGDEAGHREHADGRQVDVPAADKVADPAHAEHEGGAGDRGREDDKGCRDRAGLEVPDDRRDRDAEHGGTQADKERSQRDGRQRYAGRNSGRRYRDRGGRRPAAAPEPARLPHRLGGGHWKAFPVAGSKPTAILGGYRLIGNCNYLPDCYCES
jgi:hypothetical protein